MWPFAERRQEKRYLVDWEARLRLAIPDREASMTARIVDISLNGARLALERMHIGSYHLLIGDRPGKLFLAISLPEGAMEAPVEVRWYNWSESLKAFAVGAEFSPLEREAASMLTRAFKGLPTA